jgi:DNA-binding protein H-NS
VGGPGVSKASPPSFGIFSGRILLATGNPTGYTETERIEDTPMKTDISTALQTMTVDELAAHIREAEGILEKKREDARRAFVEEIRQKAEALGFNLDTLLSGAATKKPASRASKSDKPAEHRSVPVKYRDPQNPESTWTGRGMKPRWIRDKLEAGAKIEEFLVA